MAAIYSLYIINKSGGLIFYKVCSYKPEFWVQFSPFSRSTPIRRFSFSFPRKCIAVFRENGGHANCRTFGKGEENKKNQTLLKRTEYLDPSVDSRYLFGFLINKIVNNGFGSVCLFVSWENIGLWLGGTDGYERQLEGGELVALDARDLAAVVAGLRLFRHRASPSRQL